MTVTTAPPPLDPRKFRDPQVTARGERRAAVALHSLDTLWFNAGTVCNLACRNCYIESSPRNDRLAYLTLAEVEGFLDEIESERLGTSLIGFTGGEPFMNPALPEIIEAVLVRGFRSLFLTNAMKPLHKIKDRLSRLRRHGDRLVFRVSIDHYAREMHELERGARSWNPAIEGFKWLIAEGFTTTVAGRLFSGEPEAAMRDGFARLFAELGVPIDARDPESLLLFPEMDASLDVPEITESCWGILDKRPESVMCASSRMVVKRKGDGRPVVVACTLLPYDPRFELGGTLKSAFAPVPLNHPHCARFCVLGGAACSRG